MPKDVENREAERDENLPQSLPSEMRVTNERVGPCLPRTVPT